MIGTDETVAATIGEGGRRKGGGGKEEEARMGDIEPTTSMVVVLSPL